MQREERRLHGFLQLRLRPVIGAHAALLDHHLKLVIDVFDVVELEVHHAVRFHLHHERQAIPGDLFPIGGIVRRGEGVVLAAIARDDQRELLARHLLGALEHQMFEEMGEAGLQGRLVRAADLVPDHLNHDRRAVIRDHHDLQAVFQGEALRPERRRVRVLRREAQRAEGQAGQNVTKP